MRREINRLAEFHDKTLEEDFRLGEINKALRASKNTVLLFSIINLTFALWDYLYLSYSDISIIIYQSLIPRLAIVLAAITVSILLYRLENKKTAIKSVIVFAVLSYLLHEYSAIHFAPVELLFEVLDLVILTFGLFIIPNRWITNVCTCVFLIAVFIGLAPFTIPAIPEGTKIIVTIYLLSHVLIVGALMYRINQQKRLNYLQHLQLEALAKTDGLTKAPNRAACDKTLDKLCGDCCAFSLILADIDDFKRINDTYGHIAGDEVIVKTVDAIRKAVRQSDVVARWGGEEFVVILVQTALEGATETANRIKEYVSGIRHDGAIGNVTASFGVTAFVQGDDARSILNRADQLLYLAKKQGKNKVVSG